LETESAKNMTNRNIEVYYPFTGRAVKDKEDRELIRKTLEGDSQALEDLVRRHQNWVFNIALRMTGHSEDAQDVTQEIMVKVLTKLSTYNGKSSFRTWLYSIVSHHVINMKRRNHEYPLRSFSSYGKAIDESPDMEFPDPKTIPVDRGLLIEETKIHCLTAMLLCLDRHERLAFILGSIFCVNSKVAGELMGITPQNFRKLLSRARKSMKNFMEKRCGLIDPNNACHCRNKTKLLMLSGEINPDRLEYSSRVVKEVSASVPQRLSIVMKYLNTYYEELFRKQPFYATESAVAIIKKILKHKNLVDVFNLRLEELVTTMKS
jgi:RNA polymerase sigma factor (sigma-70 family)